VKIEIGNLTSSISQLIELAEKDGTLELTEGGTPVATLIMCRPEHLDASKRALDIVRGTDRDIVATMKLRKEFSSLGVHEAKLLIQQARAQLAQKP